jgi:two-component system, NtrC family, sensor kinase
MLPAIYAKLTLSKKIVIPFLSIFLAMSMIGLLGFGYWFSSSLEKNLRGEVESVASLVLQNFQKEEQNLLWQAQLVADRDNIRRAVKRQDTTVLLQNLLPTRTMLGLDLIKVVGVDGSTVLDLRQGWLNRVTLQDENAIKQALSGVYLSDLVSVEGQGQALLVGFTPLKSKEGIEWWETHYCKRLVAARASTWLRLITGRRSLLLCQISATVPGNPLQPQHGPGGSRLKALLILLRV